MRTQHADVRARTSADPATVYGILGDGSTWPMWIDVDSMELECEGEQGGESVGAVRVFRFRRMGIRLVTREQVVELVPQRRFSYALLSGLPFTGYRADVDLEPTDDGGTLIRWSGSWRTRIPGTRILVARLYRQFTTALVARAEARSGRR